MNQLNTLLLFFMIIGFANAQKGDNDSIYSIYLSESLADTTRVQALGDFIRNKYLFSKPDSALILADEMFDFAKSKNISKGIAEAYNIKGLSSEMLGYPQEAINNFESALLLFDSLGNKKMVAGLNINIGMAHARAGQPEFAKERFERGVEICRIIGHNNFLANGLQNLGLLYRNMGDTEKALEFLNEAKDVLKESPNQKGQVGLNINIGSIYLEKGKLLEAVDLFSEALVIAEEINFDFAIHAIYGNLSTCYFKIDDYETSISYSEKAIEIAKRLDLQSGLASSFLDIGNAYNQLGDPETSLQYLEEALSIAKAIGDIYIEINVLSELSANYQKLENFRFSDSLANQALIKSQQVNFAPGIGRAKNRLSSLAYAQGQYKKAEIFGKEAYTISQEEDNIRDLSMRAGVLYFIYKDSGQPRRALEMLEIKNRYDEELKDEENQRAVIKQQFKYDYEKQKQIDDLKNAKVVALETQRRKNQQRFSVFTGLALILALCMAYFIFNRLKLTREQKIIIEEQKLKVEQSEKYKEQFLANMSHEIRTPMHAISGMVKILQRNDPPSNQEVYLDAMSKSADNLLVILNDVLDISKIEAGKLDIQSIPINPRGVIENAIQILNFKAEEKGLELSYSMEDSVPELVMGDPTRLNQILVNLLGNAVKFTEKGQVDLKLELVDQKLSFTIKDTGIGIPKDKLNTIFGAFEQIKSDNGYSKGGTGLGLNITQQLVRLQGGEISVDSEVGEGTTFFFSLPYIAVEQAVQKAEVWNDIKLAERAGSLAGIRILLAEDNAFNQMIAKDDLNYYIQDLQLTVVENGIDALERYKGEDFDIILMDVQMPGMNGFEATRAIREYERQGEGKRSVPIIAMTASLLKSEIQKCLEVGMNNYIPKPYNHNELIGTIYDEANSFLNK